MWIRALAFVLAWFITAGPALAAPESRLDVAPLLERPPVAEPAGGWTTETGLYAEVHGAWSDRAVVRRLANHAATRVPALAERLGVLPGPTMHVYVVPTEAEFTSLQPGAPPDWADGTAWPRWSLIFLKSPSIRPGTAPLLETVLDHELVHVLLGQAFGARPVPRWLQEGMAQYYAGEAWDRRIALAQNEFGLAPLPLGTITTGFPQNPILAQLAYAQTADFVAWVAGRSGEAGLRTLVAEMAAGADVDHALQAAVGLSLDQADDAWRSAQPASHAWYRWVTNPAWWWGAAGAALGVAAWRRHRGGQRKLERWDAEEAARAAALLRAQEREAEALARSRWLTGWALPG